MYRVPDPGSSSKVKTMFDFEHEDDDFEPSLPPAPPELAHASLATIYGNLNRIFGSEEWLSYEPETFSLHLGVKLDELTLDKIEVVRTLLVDHDVQNDATFILHATDVVNNQVADFAHVPVPTSLELAYYIHAVKELMEASGRRFEVTGALRSVSWYILNEEGYSEPLAPFQFIEKDTLAKGQTAADTAAKKQAIEQYLEHMKDL